METIPFMVKINAVVRFSGGMSSIPRHFKSIINNV